MRMPKHIRVIVWRDDAGRVTATAAYEAGRQLFACKGQQLRAVGFRPWFQFRAPRRRLAIGWMEHYFGLLRSRGMDHTPVWFDYRGNLHPIAM